MRLKGEYAAGTSYDVGDVVRYIDGRMYQAHTSTKAGTPCTNTRYWGLVGNTLDDAASTAIDIALSAAAAVKPSVANNLTTTGFGKVLDAWQGKALKDLIDALDARVTVLEPAPTPDPETT